MGSSETMPSLITNTHDPSSRLRLPVETAWLYTPGAEWTYSHHPHLAAFYGRLYAIWSNGLRDEDAPGQRVLLATSEDGLCWSEPVPLLEGCRGVAWPLVLTAAGFHRYGETLTAYIGKYEYRPEALRGEERADADAGHCDTGLWAMTTTDGVSWSGPVDLGLRVVPNHGPQATLTGRLIISGNTAFPYTDDPTGLTGWRMTGVYPADYPNYADDSEGIWLAQRHTGWPVVLCEGSFYATDDGVLHMLLRTNTERLWVTESRDDGATWSTPMPTEFSDNATKFHFGRLPDGRYYYVGCPDAEPLWQRNPLVLSLSEDGICFTRHYLLADSDYAPTTPGMHKGGIYGYPHTLLYDGYLYTIVSICKERVLVLRAALSDL
ncbi:MAG: hypothetical protein BWY76_00647 [bacterium ADurb.Bin429]|nr:MAG: hypothetical protein BWY76_00647 [bacterium ADurb.Bin429]